FIDARDDLGDQRSVGLAPLHNLVDLRHAEEADRLGEMRCFTIDADDGERDRRMDAIRGMVADIAELAAHHVDRPENRARVVNSQHYHGSSIVTTLTRLRAFQSAA